MSEPCMFEGHRFRDWSHSLGGDDEQLGWAMEDLEAVTEGRSPDETYTLLWAHWGEDRVYLRVYWVTGKRRPGRPCKGGSWRLGFANVFMRYPRTDIEQCECGRAMAEAPSDENMCALCADEWEARWKAAKVVREIAGLINRIERAVHESIRRQAAPPRRRSVAAARHRASPQ